MGRFLAIDWDHQQLLVVAATARSGQVRIQKTLLIETEQNPYNADAPVLGELLRDRLKNAGIASAPVLACIGRDRIIVKDVRFPAVPPNEEPAIVRFQVVKELNEPADEVVIDYFAAADQPTTGERRAFAVVARKNVVATYQDLCKAAGLKLAALTPRPFGSLISLKRQIGTSALIPSPEPPDATVAVLTVGKPWAEFCVVRGDNMLFARSLTAGAALAGEVRRNIAVYAGQNPQHPVRAVYVAGSDAFVPLRERVQEPLGIPVHPLDPFGSADRPEVPSESRGAFAGAMGLLQAAADRRAFAVNLIKAKEPRAPRSPHRLLRALVAAAAVLLVLIGGIWCYSQLAERDAKLTELNDEITGLDAHLAKYKDESTRLKALESWTQGNVNWLDELYDLTDQVNVLDKLHIVHVNGNRVQAIGKDVKDKTAAHVELRVITNDDRAVDALNAMLERESHYRGAAKIPAGRNPGAQAIKFPRQFRLNFDVEKQTPDKYVRQLPDAQSPNNRRDTRPQRGGFTGGNFGGRSTP